MKFIKYSLFVMGLGLLGSCNPENFFETQIPLDIPEIDPQFVITGSATQGDRELTIFVTKSRAAKDSLRPYNYSRIDTIRPNPADPSWFYTQEFFFDTVANVTAKILKNGQAFKDMRYLGRGYFTADIPALQADGAVYTFVVSAPNFKNAEVSQKLPKLVPIKKITYNKDAAVDDNGERGDELILEFDDPIDEENFYQGYIEIEDTSSVQYARYYAYPIDASSEGLNLTDRTFNGKTYQWRFIVKNQDPFVPNKIATISAFLLMASKDAFYYNIGVERARNSANNPFAEPVLPYTNVKNGFGIYTMSNFSFKMLRL